MADWGNTRALSSESKAAVFESRVTGGMWPGFVARRRRDRSLEELPANHAKIVSQVGYQPRSDKLTHAKVPGGADREYLKSQNPAEGNEIRGLGAINEAVDAFPDSSNEQRDMLVVGLLATSICKHTNDHLPDMCG